MYSQSKVMQFLKKGILVSGAVVRTMIGVGAAALLVLGWKKKRKKVKS